MTDSCEKAGCAAVVAADGWSAGGRIVEAIVLLGAPGAGKGTTAEGIVAAARYAHLATGDMLREAVKNGTEFGKVADGFMKRGELVPDEIIVKIVDARLVGGGKDARYMFDGFPRTLEQSRLLEACLKQQGGSLKHVFFLEAPRDLLISRLTGRRICRSCGRNFHVVNIPPKKAGVCDLCGGELYQRSDDQESTILNRLEVFRKQTESLVAHYERAGVLVKIDAAQHRDVIIAKVLELLK
ncbi:MAG: adenylate kinase [bacterium]